MTDNEFESKNPAIKIGAGTLGAAAGAALTANAVGAATAGALATLSLEFAAQAHNRFRERRADLWWQTFVRRVGTIRDEEALTDATLHAADDSGFQERVYHALNAVWQAVDEAVLPCLAYLAADYEARGKPADVSYKRLTRFLQETTSDELAIVRRLHSALKAPFDRGASRVDVIIDRGTSEATLRLPDGDELGQVQLGSGCDVLLRRMREEFLVEDGDTARPFVAVFFSRSQFERIQRYVAIPLV